MTTQPNKIVSQCTFHFPSPVRIIVRSVLVKICLFFRVFIQSGTVQKYAWLLYPKTCQPTLTDVFPTQQGKAYNFGFEA